MNEEIKEYLQDRDYDMFFERLLMLLKPSKDCRRKVEFMDEGVKSSIYGHNNATTRVYNFSNEYLDGTFEGLDLQGKRAFVVGSSGDQALHCIQNGASEVTIVDGNMWTKPYIELKLAAIKNLDFASFTRYMSYDNIFNPHFYAKVSHDLSPESQAFWDNIMLEFGGSTLEDIAMSMDAKDEFFQHSSAYFDPDAGKKESNFYVDEEGYNRLKENLNNCKVNIELAEFSEFPEVAQGKYDLIMLSNIYDYAKGMVFFSVLEHLNNNHLTDDGYIQAHYTFGEKDSVCEDFMASLEAFTRSRKGKDIRLELKDTTSKQNAFERFLFKRKKAANIMLRKSNFGSAPEME